MMIKGDNWNYCPLIPYQTPDEVRDTDIYTWNLNLGATVG